MLLHLLCKVTLIMNILIIIGQHLLGACYMSGNLCISTLLTPQNKFISWIYNWENQSTKKLTVETRNWQSEANSLCETHIRSVLLSDHGNVSMGWAFGVGIKLLLGMRASCLSMPGAESWLCPEYSFLLVSTLKGSSEGFPSKSLGFNSWLLTWTWRWLGY